MHYAIQKMFQTKVHDNAIYTDLIGGKQDSVNTGSDSET